MSRTILLALSLFLVAFAGCFGGDDPDDADDADDDDGRDQDDDDDVTVSASRFVVTMDDHPPNATFGAEMNFTWSVGTGGSIGGGVSSDNNTTTVDVGAEEERRQVNETGLAWGFTSVSDPEDVTDYNESEVFAEAAEAPGKWNGTIIVQNPDDPGDTENNTTLFVRAYAIDENGTTSWSDEIEVEMERDPGETQIVEIVNVVTGYDPAEITIDVGDWVVWDNTDVLTHTATYRDGPEEFDTGEIEAGDLSVPIRFDAPGTYTYACDIHPTMDEATIIVTDPSNTTT